MRLTILFMSIVLMLLGCSSSGYDTLQEAVQSQWDTPIQVLNQDEERQIVIYLDQTQYVAGLYQFDNNKYIYDRESSKGHRSSLEKEYPMFVKPVEFEGAEPFLYGAIVTEEHTVSKFVIHYTNGYTQEIPSKNNTIIAEFPFATQSINDYLEEVDNVIIYDENGEIITSWK
ncbi:hypothetical protein [Sutcliffiella cohnii]|uniref:hypothetical protein n=1 Tax=Sutcliffiella cohnii TaxID=33932 RepID=UPI002E1C5D1E|nr:hypothetical protein [Sutcliffiella cohnii]